ncbi:hypothetical protein JNUCC42_22545 [Brevibacterium sp. JNUCC-42]|nr:hypothetical protein [Brevibacillus laterosporus]QOS99125.1 hypothetical protein JNUCC42_22545 [Brevibacterium sp. JNUCC-42]RAP28034.1 hypothetical protein C2W64_00500 [Brevibacillus laterosporus]
MNFSSDHKDLQGANLLDKAPFSSLLFHIENEAHEAMVEEHKRYKPEYKFLFWE